jgi:hypothetical protein
VRPVERRWSSTRSRSCSRRSSSGRQRLALRRFAWMSERRPRTTETGVERSAAYSPAWRSLVHGEARGRRLRSVPRSVAQGSRSDVGVAVHEAQRRSAMGRVPAEDWAFRLSRGERLARTVARVRVVAAISRSRYSRVPAGGLRGARNAAPRLVPSTRLEAPGRPTGEITATPVPARKAHSRFVVGDAIGFALRWDGKSAACRGSPATHPARRRRTAGRPPACRRHRATPRRRSQLPGHRAGALHDDGARSRRAVRTHLGPRSPRSNYEGQSNSNRADRRSSASSVAHQRVPRRSAMAADRDCGRCRHLRVCRELRAAETNTPASGRVQACPAVPRRLSFRTTDESQGLWGALGARLLRLQGSREPQRRLPRGWPTLTSAVRRSPKGALIRSGVP